MGWALIDEDSDVALRFGQTQRALQRCQRSRDVASRPMGERLQHQDLDDASRCWPPSSAARQEPLQESGRLVHGPLVSARSCTGPAGSWRG